MKYYVLAYCTNEMDVIDDRNNLMYYRCQADDIWHAEEQLKDAEPDINWYEVIKISINSAPFSF